MQSTKTLSHTVNKPQPHTHTQRLVHTEPHRRQQQRHEESRNENELMHKHRQ